MPLEHLERLEPLEPRAILLTPHLACGRGYLRG
jgi:hypothetical protein